MTDDLIKLGQRAVACKGWRWMPGMLAALDGIDGDYRARVCRVDNGRFWSDATTLPYDLTSYVPDLSDPATLGCLLALVREAWESPKANISWVTDDKCMVVFDTGHAQRFLLASTEAEALVAALEAALT